MYLTQLGDLLNAGLTMHDAMGELGLHTRDGRLRRMSREISSGAAAGQSLFEQMRRYPQIIPPHVRGMLVAGERAGALPQVCQELSEELRQQQQARWVASLAEIWFGLIFFLAVLVPGLPRIINIERPDWGAYGNYLLTVALPIYAGFIVVWCGAKLIGSISALAGPVQTLLYYTPWAGYLIRRSALNRTAVTLEALLRAGVIIQDALGLAAEASGNAVIERQLRRASEQVRAGRTLDEALKGVTFLPGMTKASLALGERAGSYERVLGALAEDAKAGRKRAVWVAGATGYGVVLLISALITVLIWRTVFYSIYDRIFRALFEHGLD